MLAAQDCRDGARCLPVVGVWLSLWVSGREVRGAGTARSPVGFKYLEERLLVGCILLFAYPPVLNPLLQWRNATEGKGGGEGERVRGEARERSRGGGGREGGTAALQGGNRKGVKQSARESCLSASPQSPYQTLNRPPPIPLSQSPWGGVAPLLQRAWPPVQVLGFP
jgi:hypothetical protein